MCTVSWLRRRDGYELYCNRDEKRSRARGAGPEIRERDGVRFVAPIDTAAGGAWIATNEFGVTFCLLNGAVPVRRPGVSRGLLIPWLIDSAPAEAADRARTLDLSRFAPFALAILEPHRPASLLEWDGAKRAFVHDGDDRVPLVSSSHDLAGVRTRRRAEWRRTGCDGGDSEVLFAFHSSHAGGPGPYSTCMHRDDAETVSFSRVRVTGAKVDFAYHPEAPCRRAVAETRILPRSR